MNEEGGPLQGWAHPQDCWNPIKMDEPTSKPAEPAAGSSSTRGQRQPFWPPRLRDMSKADRVKLLMVTAFQRAPRVSATNARMSSTSPCFSPTASSTASTTSFASFPAANPAWRQNFALPKTNKPACPRVAIECASHTMLELTRLWTPNDFALMLAGAALSPDKMLMCQLGTDEHVRLRDQFEQMLMPHCEDAGITFKKIATGFNNNKLASAFTTRQQRHPPATNKDLWLKTFPHAELAPFIVIKNHTRQGHNDLGDVKPARCPICTFYVLIGATSPVTLSRARDVLRSCPRSSASRNLWMPHF